MDELERWPVDWSAVQKGDFIPPERIEQWCQQKRGTKTYALKLLSCREVATREVSAALGCVVTIKCERDGLRVLKDNQASRYNADRQRQARASMMRTQARLQGVDVRELTTEEKQEHERRLTVGAMFVSALLETGKRIRALPYRRQTPGLPKD